MSPYRPVSSTPPSSSITGRGCRLSVSAVCVGNHRDEIAQELGRDHLAHLSMESGIGDRGCPVDRGEQAQLAFGCLHIDDVDVKKPIG